MIIDGIGWNRQWANSVTEEEFTSDPGARSLCRQDDKAKYLATVYKLLQYEKPIPAKQEGDSNTSEEQD